MQKSSCLGPRCTKFVKRGGGSLRVDAELVRKITGRQPRVGRVALFRGEAGAGSEVWPFQEIATLMRTW